MSRFLSGLGYNLTGMRYFLAHRRLWKFAILPLLINLSIFAGLFTLYIAHFSEIMALGERVVAGLSVPSPAGVWLHILAGLYWLLRALFAATFFLLTLILVFLSAALLSQLISANFYEAMSERILITEGYLPESPFALKRALLNMTHALMIEGEKFALFAITTVIMLALTLLPVVGSAFAILQLLITSWIFAFGLSTFPLVKERASFRSIVQWGWQRKLLLTGFGLPAIVPFLGLLITSFQVTGGTLLFLAEQHKSSGETLS
jgi:uncharacterized protein involved in cysteine biosynthesis